jgi:hypothetical protein
MISMDHASKPERTVTYIIMPNTPQWGDAAGGASTSSAEYQAPVAKAQAFVLTEAQMPANMLEVVQCTFLFEESTMYSPERDLSVPFLVLGSQEATQKQTIDTAIHAKTITLVLSGYMYCCPVINPLARWMLVGDTAMSSGVPRVGGERLFQD